MRAIKPGVLGLVLLLAACGKAAAPPPADVITPAEALVLAQPYDAQSNQVNRTADIGLLTQIESGPALDADRVTIADPAYKKTDTHESAVRVLVPHQRTRPAYFLSEDKDDDGRLLTLHELAAGAAQWQVVLWGYVGSNVDYPSFAVGSDGYAETVSAARRANLVAPADLIDEMSASVPASIAGRPSPQPGWPAVDLKQFDPSQMKAIDGFASGSATGAGEGPLWSLRDGTGLACLQMTLTYTLRPYAIHNSFSYYTQPADHSAFGYLLPPGKYGVVEESFALMAFGSLPPKSSGHPPTIPAAFVGVTSVTR